MSHAHLISQMPWAAKAKLYAKGLSSLVPAWSIYPLAMFGCCIALHVAAFNAKSFASFPDNANYNMPVHYFVVVALYLIMAWLPCLAERMSNYSGGYSVPFRWKNGLKKTSSLILAATFFLNLSGNPSDRNGLLYSKSAVEAAFAADLAASKLNATPDSYPHLRALFFEGCHARAHLYDCKTLVRELTQAGRPLSLARAKQMASAANGEASARRWMEWLFFFSLFDLMATFFLWLVGIALAWARARGISPGLALSRAVQVATSCAAQSFRAAPGAILRALPKLPAALWRALSRASALAKGQIEKAALSDPQSVAKLEKAALSACALKELSPSPAPKRL